VHRCQVQGERRRGERAREEAGQGGGR
jgi:transcription termination factor Rho